MDDRLSKLSRVFIKHSDFIILFFVLSIATYLRFLHLTTSSLWFDELSTMKVCDPELSWSEWLNNLKTREVMPPLFFFIERILFKIFGYSDIVVRGFSAVCGVLGVYGMFLLGKELSSSKLGLIFASLLTVNFFSISYSQEARPYAMALMFSIFCIYSFIRLVKHLRKVDVYIFSLFCTCTLYSIFYSMFFVFALGIVMIILLFTDSNDFKLQLNRYSLATAVVFVLCLPLIPIFLFAAKIKSFWIPPITSDFAINFFWGYFGDSALLKPIIILLIISYLVVSFQDKSELSSIRKSANQLSFLIFSLVIISIFIIPYIYSMTVVPMLFPRYTIEVSAIFIMMIGMGIYLVKSMVFKYIILFTFLVLSVLDVVVSREYYKNSIYSRPQYKQVIEYVAKFSNNITIIEDPVDGWAHSYYVKNARYDGKHLYHNSVTYSIDSVLNVLANNDKPESFWVIGGWSGGIKKLDTARRNKITKSSYYFLRADSVFKDHFGAELFAELYIGTSGASILKEFINDESSFHEGALTIYSGKITSNPIKTDPGKYKLTIIAKGQKALSAFPQLSISVNRINIGQINTNGNFVEFEFEISVNNDPIKIEIDMENDFWSPTEDRNTFIKSVILTKKSIEI